MLFTLKEDKRKEVMALLSYISEAYIRMSTNIDPAYRRLQMNKCDEWLARMTEIMQDVDNHNKV